MQEKKAVKILQRLADANWVAVILFPLTIILMEVFWVHLWLVWVSQLPGLNWSHPPLILLSLTLLLSISFFITRFFFSRKWRLCWVRLGIVSCGLTVIFIVVRVEYGAGFGLLNGQWFVYTGRVLLDSFSHLHPIVVALIVAACLWWRGISLGRSSLYFNDIYCSFLVGLAALVVLIIVWGASLGASSLEDFAQLGLQVAGFFFFSLAALALANLQVIRQKMLPGGMTAALSRQWLSIVLAVVGGIVCASIGLASIMSAEFIEFLGRTLNLASSLVSKVAYYLFIPIGYVVEWLFYIIRWLINWIRHGQLPPSFQAPGASEIENLPEAAAAGIPPEVVLVIKWFFFALVIAGVIFLLARAVSRYFSSREKADIEEIHESLWSWDLFKADLYLLLSNLRRRFELKRKTPEEAMPGWYAEDFPGILSIRQLYQCLLWEASRLNIARKHHETPYEYAERLGKFVPDGREQLNELSSLYTNVRYGEIEIQEKPLAYANNLWKILRGLLYRLGESQPVG